MSRLKDTNASGQEHVKEETDFSQEKKDYICPVCGKGLGDQVPDMEGVLDELFYDGNKVRIVSEVTLEADFCHARDEKGFTLDESHPLAAVIKAQFDSKGRCTAFDIAEICPLK